MTRFLYAFTNGEWSCAYLGMTGRGATPEQARFELLVIAALMSKPWKSAPIQ